MGQIIIGRVICVAVYNSRTYLITDATHHVATNTDAILNCTEIACFKFSPCKQCALRADFTKSVFSSIYELSAKNRRVVRKRDNRWRPPSGT